MTQSKFRYERKYLSTNLLPSQLENFLKLSPAFFKPIYYPRQVISMYFDTPDLDLYQQNLIGDSIRKKVRVRWYQSKSKITPIQLEVKIKHNQVNQKIIHPLKQTINQLSAKKLSDLISTWLKTTTQETFALKPVLVTGYSRQYFLSDLFNLRATIDSDLRFQKYKHWQNQQLTHRLSSTILELKYELEKDNNISQIINSIPMRLSKSSKYVFGTSLCN